ncbi:MAG: hypothetical protein IIY16_02900 [Oscillospiraceae bacterium]|nr:hypothetical protein [Oscillospiraceae bacterium]
MEEKRTVIQNDNGSTTVKTVREKTAEDGFVPLTDMYENKLRHRGEYHKGYMKTTSYTTNDPRITRPFTYGICGIFVLLGILMFLFGGGILRFMAVIFLVMGIYAFISCKRKIDKVEKELKEKRGGGGPEL